MIERPEKLIAFYNSPILPLFLLIGFLASFAVIPLGGEDSMIDLSALVESSPNHSTLPNDPLFEDEGREFVFTTCCFSCSGPDAFEMISGFFLKAGTFAALPAVIATNIWLGIAGPLISGASVNALTIAANLLFLVFNSYFWISIAFITNDWHDQYRAVLLERIAKPILPLD